MRALLALPLALAACAATSATLDAGEERAPDGGDSGSDGGDSTDAAFDAPGDEAGADGGDALAGDRPLARGALVLLSVSADGRRAAVLAPGAEVQTGPLAVVDLAGGGRTAVAEGVRHARFVADHLYAIASRPPGGGFIGDLLHWQPGQATQVLAEQAVIAGVWLSPDRTRLVSIAGVRYGEACDVRAGPPRGPLATLLEDVPAPGSLPAIGFAGTTLLVARAQGDAWRIDALPEVGLRPLAARAARRFFVEPGGRRLLYLGDYDAERRLGTLRLRAVEGEAEEALAAEVGEDAFGYVPGGALLYVQRPGAGGELWLRPRAGEPRRLASGVVAPGVASSDGTWITFSRAAHAELSWVRDLWIVPAAGGEPVAVAAAPNAILVGFTPRATRLLYVDPIDRDSLLGPLRSWDVAAAASREVGGPTAGATALDERRVVYRRAVTPDGFGTVRLADLESGASAVVAESVAEWSLLGPDWTRIAYTVRRGSEGDGLWVTALPEMGAR